MPVIQCLSLTRTARGLWSLYGLRGILLRRRPLESLSLMADITPRQHKLSSKDYVRARNPTDTDILSLYKPLMLSLPSNDDLKLLLTSLSTRLTNRYLVTRIIQCPPDPSQPSSNITTPLYSVAKPFIWHRNESAGSVSERSGGELRGETKGDQVMVNDIDEMML